MTHHAKMIAGGKVVIPADLRRDLGLKPGDTMVIEREGDALVLKSYLQVVREMQAEFRNMVGDDYSVDRFLAERKADWGEE